MVVTLPVHVPLQRDVNPMGFTQQLAIANGFRNVAHFAAITGIKLHGLRAGEPSEIALLERWTGSDLSPLHGFSMLTGEKVVPLGHAKAWRSYVNSVNVRYCPHCLADDLSAPSAKPHDAYIRGSWMWLQLFACPVHGVPFSTGPRMEQLGDLSLLAAPATMEARPDPSDQYFHGLVLGRKDIPYLDEMEANVATELCTVIGHMANHAHLKRTPIWIVEGFLGPSSRSRGFEIAKNGERAVYEFLRDFPRVTDRRPTVFKTLYTPVIRWMGLNINDPSYRKLVDFFQDFAEENLPLAPGERFIRVVPERKVHTPRTASIEYDIPELRIERVVRANKGFINGSKNFKREEMHQYIVREQEMIRTMTAAEIIGCSETMIDTLLKAGVIGFTRNRGPDDRLFRFVAESDVNDFLRRLASVVEERDVVDESATRGLTKTRYKLPTIIQLVLDGKIRAVVPRGTPARIDTIRLDRDDILREKRADPTWGCNQGGPGMVDPQGIVTVLHMTVSAVEELFRIGLLKGGRRRKNTTRHARRAHISELIEFKKHYISATDAAAEFGLASPKLLVEALTKKGVQPVVRTFRNISCVYRRDDVKKAFFT